MPMVTADRTATYDRAVSVTPIRIMGDPVLRTPAAPVVDFDRELQQLVADLTDTMHAAGGAGLAAPQIGVGLRVFTWYVDGDVGHLVNPDVEPVGEETDEDAEGCLSIPGFRFDCRRHLYVAATGWSMHGEPILPTDEDYSGVLKMLGKPLLDCFREFYADTALCGGRIGTVCGLEFYGVGHVLFASDANTR